MHCGISLNLDGSQDSLCHFNVDHDLIVFSQEEIQEGEQGSLVQMEDTKVNVPNVERMIIQGEIEEPILRRISNMPKSSDEEIIEEILFKN